MALPKFDEVYKSLNDAQRQAVDSIEDGPVMVIAGAGTGKTRVIGARIAKILKDTDLNPSNILCMTFTDAGVSAMVNTLIQIIGPDGYKVKVCTFHSFCNEVISSHPELFPQVNKDAEPVTEVEQVRIILDLLSKLDIESYLRPYAKQDTYLNQCMNIISRLKREYIHPDEYKKSAEESKTFFKGVKGDFAELRGINYRKLTPETFNDLFKKIESKGFGGYQFIVNIQHIVSEMLRELNDLDGKEAAKHLTSIRQYIKDTFNKSFSESIIGRQIDFAKIYEGYQNALIKTKKYDYDDMIVYTVDTFKTNPELLSEYQELYQYILVDEYQDTNAAQNEAVFLLGSFFPNPNIFVVGDDDQSIYKFQGANTQNIFAFKEKYKEYVKIITLTNNYRSHQLILDAAGAVIKNNESRLVKLMEGVNKDLKAKPELSTRPIEVAEFINQDQEALFIIDKVKSLLKENVEAGNVAILCRDNKDIEYIRDMLAKAGVPASRDEGEDIFNSPIIRQLFNLLKYLVDQSNNEALFMFLNAGFANILNADVIRLNNYANKTRSSMSELFLDYERPFAEAGLKDKDAMVQMAVKFNDWRIRMHNTNAVVFFNELINESGLMNYILELPAKVDELGKLNRLYKEIKALTEKDNKYTLSRFVSDLELYDSYGIDLIDSQTNLIQNRVKLSTVHKSKGLEYRYVFLFNCVNKKWSNKTNTDKIKLPSAFIKGDVVATDNDEERRLFYVALTRAMEHVVITYSTNSDTARSVKEPAMFIKEIPENLVQFKKYDNKESLVRAEEFVLSNKSKLNISDEMRSRLLQNIEDLKLTITHINSYLKCPRCFFYKTILRIPKLKTESLSLGTTIHETLKYIQVYLNENSKPPSQEQIFIRFKNSLEKEFLKLEEYNNVLEKGQRILSKLITEKCEIFVKGSVCEKNMGVYNLIWEGIPIAGKIDLIRFLTDDKKSVEVIDYKTGNPDTKSSQLSQKNLGDYYKQLLFYKLLIESTPQLNWKVGKGTLIFVEQSRKDEKSWIQKEYAIKESDYEALKMVVKKVYSKIKNLEFDECGDKCDNHELHDINLNM